MLKKMMKMLQHSSDDNHYVAWLNRRMDKYPHLMCDGSPKVFHTFKDSKVEALYDLITQMGLSLIFRGVKANSKDGLIAFKSYKELDSIKVEYYE